MPKGQNGMQFLSSEAAFSLYRGVSARLLPIAPDKQNSNLTERWLSMDPVRGAMRAAGVEETFITGDASDFEKLTALLGVMPQLGSHRAALWCRHDLSHTFGCELELLPENAEAIWRKTAAVMGEAQTPKPTVFTPVSVLLSPDRGIRTAANVLGARVNEAVKDLDSLCRAYACLLDDFVAVGGKEVALTLDPATPFVKPDTFHANDVLVRALQKDGRGITGAEKALFFAQMARFFGKECLARGLTLRLHAVRELTCGHTAVPLPIADIGGLAALLKYLSELQYLPRTLLAARNAAELSALSPLFTAFAAIKAEEPRLLPALEIPPCFDPDSLRAELAAVSSFVPLGALTPCLGAPQALVRDVLARVLCDLLSAQCEQGAIAGGMAAAEALILTVLA